MAVVVTVSLVGSVSIASPSPGAAKNLSGLIAGACSGALDADAVHAALDTMPPPEAIVAQALAALTAHATSAQADMAALVQALLAGGGGGLKPPAHAFVSDLLAQHVQLVRDSLTKLGSPPDEWSNPKNASEPAEMHFMSQVHTLTLNPALEDAWVSCLNSCGAPGAPATAAPRHWRGPAVGGALQRVVALARDHAYVRLCQALAGDAAQFVYLS